MRITRWIARVLCFFGRHRYVSVSGDHLAFLERRCVVCGKVQIKLDGQWVPLKYPGNPPMP